MSESQSAPPATTRIWHRAATAAAPLLPLLFGNVPAHAAAPAQQADIAYGSDPAQLLDLYTPASAPPYKLVLFVHGGGWTKGGKGAGHKIAPPLVAAGYALASVDYRTVPQTTPAGATADVAHAIAYLLNNAARYHLDPRHFALMGHSAGATLVALLATDPTYLRGAGVDPARLAATITLDGLFDVKADLADHPNDARAEKFGNDAASWARYSPALQLPASPKPNEFCALHEDSNRRYQEQADLFIAALKSSGAHYVATTVHGYKHAELVKAFDDPGTPMAPFVLSCLAGALPVGG